MALDEASLRDVVSPRFFPLNELVRDARSRI